MATPKLKPRDIRYLNKDFSSFRDNLIEFSKTYFPKTYSDFNESSPGMLFIEMSSYVGDVLSYYIDDSLKESMMLHAQDKRNVISLSQYLGYKPKVTSPAVTTLTVYQLVKPTTEINESGDEVKVPDENYYLRIQPGMIVESRSNPDIKFVTNDEVDFSSKIDREINVFSVNETSGDVEEFIVTKKVTAISATIRERTFEFGSAESFSTIDLNEDNVIDIQDVRDDDGNKYYEVPYLAQEMVYVDYPNLEIYDEQLSKYKDETPHLLKLLKTPRRFTTKVNEDETTTITFGSADPAVSSETLIPNFKNVGLGTNNSISRLNESFDPTNFLNTKTYGQAPSNTELTVKYLIGGGVESNVPSGDLTRIVEIEFDSDLSVEQSDIRRYQRSVAVENEVPAVGGRGGETLEEIRENALANFNAQNRAVTRKDYVVRTLSLPPKYGSVTKAYVSPDSELDDNSPASILKSRNTLEEFSDMIGDFLDMEEKPTESEIKEELQNRLQLKQEGVDSDKNPFAINLYLLGYDNNKNLTELNKAIKENVKTYLNEYRMLTDDVNIVDGFIVNIGIDFEITVYPNYNKREVLLDCLSELKEYFDIDNWTFNMPINISEVEVLLAGVEGVASVPSFEVTNKCGGNYSPNSYNIEAATKNNIVYPSLDPCVFEVKYPNRDIRGRTL